MKLVASILIPIWVWLPAMQAWPIINPYRFASGGVTTLFTETFEGTGYVNAWTEVPGTGTVDEDDTSAPTDGVQDLKISKGATASTYAYPTNAFTASTQITSVFTFRVSSHTSNRLVFALSNTPNGTLYVQVYVKSTGAMQIYGNSAASVSATTSDTSLADATTYWCKVIINTASGSYSAEFNTSNSFSGSGTKYASNTNGTADSSTLSGFRCEGGLASSNAIFDSITLTTP